MKTRSGIDGSHRGKGPLKRPHFMQKDDSPESDTTDDQDEDPDYAISKKPSPPKKCKWNPVILPYPDELPDLEPIPPRSQPRTKVKKIPSKKKQCQRQNQIESSDSDTEAAESDDPGEEPQKTPESRAIKQRWNRMEDTQSTIEKSQSGASSDSDTDQTIEISPSEASDHSDVEQPVQGTPSGASSDEESPRKRTKRTKRKQNQIKDSSNSDTEPAEPDSPEAAFNNDESHRTQDIQVKQKRRRRRKCQRQVQAESSDSETESRQPESVGSGPSDEEPHGSSNSRGNSQLPRRRSIRIHTRKNRPFRKPTRNDIYDKIELDAGRPRKSAITKRAAGFTRESHFYNRDNLPESETSSVDEYVPGKYTVEVTREQAEREEREREVVTQEHEYRQINLAIEQQQWERDRINLANEIEDIERRYRTATDESSTSDDEDSQPRPEEDHQADDDNDNDDEEEDDSMYGVDDAPADRPMTNRPEFGPGAIETDEELEAWMLAFDDRDLVDPRNTSGGQERQAEKGSQEVSDDEGSIIIYSDSEEEDVSVPVQSTNMSSQDIPVVLSSTANINDMPSVPSCSMDYSAPVQPMAPIRSDIDEMLAVPSCSKGDSNPVEPTLAPSASDTDQMLSVPSCSKDDSGPFQPTLGPSALNTDQMLAVPSYSSSYSGPGQLIASSRSDINQMLAVPSCSKDDSGPVQPTIGPSRSDIDQMLAVPSCSNSGFGSVQPIVIQPINGPSGSDVNEALPIPSCSKDDPGSDQPEINSSPQELQSRGQPNVLVKREETSAESSNTNGQDSHSVESASHLVPKEEDRKEDICVCSQTLVRRQLFSQEGDEAAASTSLQLKVEPTERDNHSEHIAESTSFHLDTKEEDMKFCACSQKPLRRELFAGTADGITASRTRQIKEEPTEGTTDIEQFSAESTSGSLESEERNAGANTGENAGENRESAVADDDSASAEVDEQMITPVKRKSFRLIVSEDEEEQKNEEKPGPSGHHNYARPPVTDTEDETEESSNEADSNQNSESDGEGETSRSPGSENDEDDYGRRRSKRALITPQKRRYQESMMRYKMLRERKKSVVK